MKTTRHHLLAMSAMLTGHGDRFSGGDPEQTAREWLDEGFSAETADEWCQIGVWAASVAAAFRDSGKTPAEIVAACERLMEASASEDEYTSSSELLYRVCNADGPTDAQDIIDACD